MNINEKLEILADAAKHDASCSSSGSNRKNTGGIGNAAMGGICHSWSADGRCISLLKVLLTNACIYDCEYCANRKSNDIRRATFSPEEIADLTIAFYRRNYIEGLFLSSAVIKTPDYTMELLIRALTILRNVHHFSGYIHVKAIPGASNENTKKLGTLADRMSVNIELPSSTSLSLLAPDKSKTSILTPMSYIKNEIIATSDEKQHIKSTPDFAPAGQTTQMIIGASGETDKQILTLSQGLYDKFSLKRVYFSAYVPLNKSNLLPAIARPPLLREHRLYQSDWLMRLYGFHATELLSDTVPNLDPNLDPKAFWALNNLQYFPIEVNCADYQLLLRVPGIGLTSAKRIVEARRSSILREDDLKKIGVVMKRARHFLTANGRYTGLRFDSVPIRSALITADSAPGNLFVEQLSFLPEPSTDWSFVLPSLPNVKTLPNTDILQA